MNLRPLLAFLAVAPLLSGCVVHPRPVENPGDISLAWTFQGFHCVDDPQIAVVHVDIPGEVLANNGDFACTTGGADGITLHDFNPGTYQVTLTAYDGGGNPLYGPTTGSVHVNGSVSVAVDLAPVGGPVSAAYFKWNLAETATSTNPLCANAIPNGEPGGIATIFVKIDNGDFFPVNCADGQTQAGAYIGIVSDVTHTVTLVASGSAATGQIAFDYEQFDGVFSPTGTGTSTFTFDFNAQSVTPWLVGGADFTFKLFNSGHSDPSVPGDGQGLSCAAAHVDTLFVNFYDRANNHYLYPGAGDPQPCAEPHELFYPYLNPGNFELVLTVHSTDPSTTFDDLMAAAATVTVTEGLFPAGPTTNVDLDQVPAH